jgi:hypothetical protein
MSHQEKQSIVSLIVGILISVIYFVIVFLRYNINSLANDFRFWATVILIYVLIQIVMRIILNIILAIVTKIMDNEDIPTISDEMDKLIDLKSTRNNSIVFGAGFLLSMLLIAFGVPLVVMFYVFLFATFTASVVSDISMIYFYRKGV